MANDRLDDRTKEYSRYGPRVPFFCECPDDECLGRVELTHGQYREIRAHRGRYVILPGHPMIENERIIADNDDFHVVEKAPNGQE